MAPVSSSSMAPRNVFMDWNDMNRAIGFAGVPLDTTTFVRGMPNMQETIQKIERQNVPANTYDLPPGLTRREMPGPPR